MAKDLSDHRILFHLGELRSMSCVNLALSFFTLMYVGVNIVCIVINSYDNECYTDASEAVCNAVTSTLVFHLMEFWATFAFNVISFVAVAYSPKKLTAICSNPLLLKFLVFINLVTSFISAMLVTINLGKFEVVAHELEYTNELTMALIDLCILVSLVRGLRKAGSTDEARSTLTSSGMLFIATCVAIVQLIIYNGMGWSEDGEPLGERPAHYCEFIFEIISATITFWFTMDNKLLADTQIADIMVNRGPKVRCADV
eukprot:TRINITY_DN10008_c0_g1_i1.p1 TRINITY_DN10008_c0_g1~~TRINITY_DN10008_c0_g1_i1.p1  ORF type:complete len:279 (+),score=34.78 TRINITY_DN10008_c0_g1_i1:68-838(+)